MTEALAPADWTMKANDRLPVIRVTLKRSGVAVNLTTATGVDFIMRAAEADGTTPATGEPKLNAPAVIDNAAAGDVYYPWLAVDTDTPGRYLGEWEVHWPDDKSETFPNDEYHTIAITADLDGAT